MFRREPRRYVTVSWRSWTRGPSSPAPPSSGYNRPTMTSLSTPHTPPTSNPTTIIRSKNRNFLFVLLFSRCSHVIVAIPPSEIMKVVFEPTLSEDKLKILSRPSEQHFIKFVITYREVSDTTVHVTRPATCHVSIRRHSGSSEVSAASC